MKTSPKPDNWMVLIHFLIFLLPAAALVGGITAVTWHVETTSKLTVFKKEQTALINRLVHTISNDFGLVVSTLLYLSELQEFKQMQESGHMDATDLAENYLSFSKWTGLFGQIRYLDDSGMEIVRVNYNKGNPVNVPAERLQFKGNRYYFKETISLNKGEVFVSPLDLNIEHGKIELPLKPMIRFGTPVFDGYGKKKGRYRTQLLWSETSFGNRSSFVFHPHSRHAFKRGQLLAEGTPSRKRMGIHVRRSKGADL